MDNCGVVLHNRPPYSQAHSAFVPEVTATSFKCYFPNIAVQLAYFLN